MAARTLPLDLDLVVYAGATFHREFRWKPNGKTPQDFTGWSARGVVGVRGQDPILTVDTDHGITLTPDGLVIIDISAQVTGAQLSVPMPLMYNLDLVAPDGSILRFLRGRVSVVRDVGGTRP